MAAISNSNASSLYADAGLHKTVLYRLAGVNTGDTIDVGVVGGGGATFRRAQVATFITASQSLGTVSINGTILTLMLAGMANESVNLLVTGQG